MSQECGKCGISCLIYLRDQIDPTGTVDSIEALLQVLKKPLGPDSLIADIRAKIATNDRLPDELALQPKVLTAVIITQLPPSLATFTELVVQEKEFPSPSNLISKLTTSIGLQRLQNGPEMSFVAASHFRKIKTCINCDGDGHYKSDCKKAPADCDVCGPGIGHLPKHCLVQCQRDIPASIPEAAKEKILQKRKEFFAAKEKAGNSEMACAACDDNDDPDDEFMMEFIYDK